MIKVLVVDDHEVVREGLKQIVSRTHNIVVAAEASNGQAAYEQMSKEPFDVMVLDISMPGRGGLEVLKHIRAEQPKFPILILTMYPEEQYAVRALKAGASGYLTKDCVSEELVGAIEKIAQGGRYISFFLSEQLAYNLEID